MHKNNLDVYVAALVVILILATFGLAYAASNFYQEKRTADPPESESEPFVSEDYVPKEDHRDMHWTGVNDYSAHVQADIDEVRGTIAKLKKEDQKKQEAVDSVPVSGSVVTAAPRDLSANVHSQTTNFLKNQLGITTSTTATQAAKGRQQSRTRVTQAIAYVGADSGKEDMVSLDPKKPSWYTEMSSGPIRPPQKRDMAKIREASYRNGIDSEERYSMTDELRDEIVAGHVNSALSRLDI